MERECLVQHGIATIACLTAGKEAFSRDPPPESVFIDVLRGLHGFHIYSKEYWTDYLFSLATPDGESDTALLFNMAHQLATNWALLEQDHLPSHEENASIGKTPVAIVDERISSLSDPVLQRFVNTCLTARSLDQLEVCVQQAETTGASTGSNDIDQSDMVPRLQRKHHHAFTTPPRRSFRRLEQIPIDHSELA